MSRLRDSVTGVISTSTRPKYGAACCAMCRPRGPHLSLYGHRGRELRAESLLAEVWGWSEYDALHVLATTGKAGQGPRWVRMQLALGMVLEHVPSGWVTWWWDSVLDHCWYLLDEAYLKSAIRTLRDRFTLGEF